MARHGSRETRRPSREDAIGRVFHDRERVSRRPGTRDDDAKDKRTLQRTVEAQLHRRDRHRVQFVDPVELGINSKRFRDQFLGTW